MSRQVTRVPATVQCLTTVTAYTCDKCAAVFSQEDQDDGNGTSEIMIALDQDECVGAKHRRDYCADCAGPVWAAICAAIGEDPDRYERTGLEDE